MPQVLKDMSDNDSNSIGRQSLCSNSSPSPVKIAVLCKRSQGLHRFTRPNYRHRVFILTDQALSYYSGSMDRIGSIKGRIPIELVKAVEFVEQGALGLAHTLQVIYQSKKHGYVTLYITGHDPQECSEWVAAIRQACYFNQDMLMHYHPGAYGKTGWTCCQQRHKPTLGCQPTNYLLTRSSSRYADMRRQQRHSRRSNSRPYSSPHGTTDVNDQLEQKHVPTNNIRSNSCDNLHVVRHNHDMCSDFTSLSHLADTPTVSSCYTLAAHVSDVTMPTPSDSQVTLTETRLIPTKRDSFEDEKSRSTEDIVKSKPITETSPRRHQIALTPLLISHRPRHASIDSGTESIPHSAKKILYVGGGSRASTISCDSRDDYLFQTWPRKASIEPRISNTDPEVIHV